MNQTKGAPIPNINIYSPLSTGAAYKGSYHSLSERYRQSIRLLGGYWQASWTFREKMSRTAKINFFRKMIGSHVECSSGGRQVWEGLIWSMDLNDQGVHRRISLEDTRNRIKTAYTTTNGEQAETSWYSKNDSINKYGRIEEILNLSKVAAATAQAYAQTVVNELQKPIPRAINFTEPNERDVTELSVNCVGYVYTLNFEYLNITDTARDINVAITAALTALNNNYITTGKIAANTIEVRPPDNPIKVWEWFEEINDIGDGTNPYTIQVLNKRRLNYQALSPRPTIFWDGKHLRDAAQHNIRANPYTVKPGIIRDLNWSSTKLTSDYFLTQSSDSVVEEVEAGEGYTMPILKTTNYQDSDFLAALAANEMQMKEE